MTSKPTIIVQLVHIKGPLQGEIQEFFEPELVIGRHPSCQVKFPRDLAIISRIHARILREGNRFKLVDESTNGTFLNGKIVKEAFLKDGDVLIFADGGPKVSFLTKFVEGQPEIHFQSPAEPSAASAPAIPTRPVTAKSPPSPHMIPSPTKKIPVTPAREPAVERKKAPLIIQYGPTLRSFNELPIIIGKIPGCDFILDHPAVLERHAQIFYSQEQYWVKDLTGQNRISINGKSIPIQAPLQPENRLSLSSQGPSFRFLGAGRLAEIEESIAETPRTSSPKPEPKPSRVIPPTKVTKVASEKLKKFFKR